MPKLKDELDANPGLPDRSKVILSMFPGCLFGFPPPNLNEMIERLDCPVCQEILEVLTKVLEVSDSLNEKINNFCKPVRDKNESAQKKYEKRHKMFILGRLFKKPEPEQDPDYKNQSWYAELNDKLNELMGQLETVKQKDPAHWGDEENDKISKEFTSAYFHRDCWVTSSGPGYSKVSG